MGLLKYCIAKFTLIAFSLIYAHQALAALSEDISADNVEAIAKNEGCILSESEPDSIDLIDRSLACAGKLRDKAANVHIRKTVWPPLLKRAKKILPKSDVRLSLIYIELTMIDIDLGAMESAQKNAQKGLEVHKFNNDSTSPHYGRSLFILASTETRLRQFDKAEKHYTQAMEILEKQTSHLAAEYLSSLYFEYALHKSITGKYADAVTFMQKSYDFQIKNAPNMPNTAIAALALAGMSSSAHLPDSEKKARDAVEVARRILGPNHAEFATALEVLGIDLQRQGRIHEAVKVLIEAVNIKRKALGSNNMRLGYAMYNLATLLTDTGKSAASLSIMNEAREIFKNTLGTKSIMYANSFANSAISNFHLGNYEEALADRKNSVRLLEEIVDKDHRDLILARTGLVESFVQFGDYSLATEQSKKAWLSSSSTLPKNHIYRIDNLATLGFTQILNGNVSEGWKNSLNAFTRLKKILIKNKILQNGGKVTGFYRSAFLHILESAYLSHKYDTAFEVAQYLLETELAGSAAAATRRLTSTDPNFAQKHKTISDLSHQINKLNTEHLKLLAEGKDGRSIAAKMKDLQRSRSEKNSSLKTKYPSWSEKNSFDIASANEFRKKLTKNEVALIVLNSVHHTYSLLLTHKGIIIDRTKVSLDKYFQTIRKVRDTLAQDQLMLASVTSEETDASPLFSLSAAHELYNIIFTPKIRSYLKDIDKIHLITNSNLSSIPFSLLVSNENNKTSPLERLKNAHWLIKDYAVQRFASVGTYGKTTSSDAKDTELTFIGIGAPLLSANLDQNILETSEYFRGGNADIAALKEMPSLPGANVELKRLEIIFGKDQTQILSGAQANETNVKSMNLKDANYLVFATHGLVSGQIGGLMEPALVLTPPETASNLDDGLLTASEITFLDINADWVILSACNTAAGDNINGAGFTGLGRSFIYAGAKAVLLSHWPVRDDISALITTKAISYAKSSNQKSEALRKAMLEIMQNPKIKNSYHPVIWAPFELLER